VKLETGWAYLTALLEWFSGYVIAWELSPALDTAFCVSTLNQALDIAVPDNDPPRSRCAVSNEFRNRKA